MAKIFLDPGHGAHDPGAIGKKSNEKTNVLKVANRLASLLRASGHTVKLSRTTDVFLSLSERARLANNWGADVFISLHNNAAASASATGFETFIFNGNVSSKTRELQNAIHNAIIKEIGIRDRGKKRANFAVIRETKMPAVLIEYAFISNTGDENVLINEVEKLARTTAEGVRKFAGGKAISSSTNTNTTTSKPKTNTDNKVQWVGTNDKGKRIEAIASSVNYYDTQRWTNPSGSFKKGQGWIVDNLYRVNGSLQYRVQNNNGKLFYITARKDLVRIVNGSGNTNATSTKSKANLVVDGYLGKQTIMALQRYFNMKHVDGIISSPSAVVKALQKFLGVKQDGYIGKVTITAMQKKFNMKVADGIISKPSAVIKELQRRLNKGKL